MANTFTLPLRPKHMATSANTSNHHDCALSEPAANTIPRDSAFGRILAWDFLRRKNAIYKQHSAAMSDLAKKHSARLRNDLEAHYLLVPSFFSRPRREIPHDLVKLHCNIVSKGVFTSDGRVRKLPVVPKHLRASAERRFLEDVAHLREDYESAMSSLVEEIKVLCPDLVPTCTGPV
ncbi:uncharacterized protein E0L32_003447 [Thyridium curvatum]|uniref:Uncharacterized protein n=1 Tax=Thyridium curvatum TaxID=1093900 RepID=A0A507B1B8_9PEZI|nr:uncharacterized protein E0L32_003447 [Thyridium curvatum]TPX16885.1 hypothetical protein E0L32_003447 [Thyridium curvatum]